MHKSKLTDRSIEIENLPTRIIKIEIKLKFNNQSITNVKQRLYVVSLMLSQLCRAPIVDICRDQFLRYFWRCFSRFLVPRYLLQYPPTPPIPVLYNCYWSAQVGVTKLEWLSFRILGLESCPWIWPWAWN